MDLGGGLLPADLISAPGPLDLASDALQRLDLLVGRQALVVQVVHVRPNARILLQQRLPQCLQPQPWLTSMHWIGKEHCIAVLQLCSSSEQYDHLAQGFLANIS